MVQPASSALLSMGTCQRQLPENSSLVIRQETDCACAALVTVPPPLAAAIVMVPAPLVAVTPLPAVIVEGA